MSSASNAGKRCPYRSAVTSVDPERSRAPTTFRPATFRGRLLALQEGRRLEVGGAGKWALSGVIESVNVEHLLLTSSEGSEYVVPLDSIGYLIRRPTDLGRRQRAH